MHPNPAFRKETRAQNIAFAKQRSFGTLAINADDGPLLSHVPFILNDAGTEAELHLVRSNPIVGLLKSAQKAVISVLGGDAYVSPDWYGVDDQVPTWNYVAVHLRGEISLLKHAELHGVLDRLSAEMEARLAPKKAWTSQKMDQQVYARMQRQIVPVRFQVAEINGTWKLSQNKPVEVRKAAKAGLSESGFGSDVENILGWMED